jgi:hypothetical protein
MPNPILDDMTKSVGDARGAMQSATILIDGIQARIDAAVATAIGNGATAEQLAPFTELSAALESDSVALSAAVAKNP